MSCPICARPTDRKHRPFCSKRCQQIDLGKWLSGAYAIPAEEEDRPDEDSARNERGEPPLH